jgi:DNA polymerase III epsilon subunit-like protein
MAIDKSRLKLLYFDTETTGLDPIKNGLVQLSGIIEIGGEVVREFDFTMAPFPDDQINESALEVIGKSKADIELYESSLYQLNKLLFIFNNYIDVYKKDKTIYDRFLPVAHNARFDLNVLQEWFKKCGHKYFFSYINPSFAIDTLTLANQMRVEGKLDIPDSKLGTIGSALGIDFKAHDALEDVRVCRAFYQYYLLNK